MAWGRKKEALRVRQGFSKKFSLRKDSRKGLDSTQRVPTSVLKVQKPLVRQLVCLTSRGQRIDARQGKDQTGLFRFHFWLARMRARGRIHPEKLLLRIYVASSDF